MIGNRDVGINDNVVNKSVDKNRVGAHVNAASETVIPRRSTCVRKTVLKYGFVPYE